MRKFTCKKRFATAYMYVFDLGLRAKPCEFWLDPGWDYCGKLLPKSYKRLNVKKGKLV